jgi:membrane protein
VIVLLAFFGMETTYRYSPCCGPRWRFISPGTVFSTGGWVAATLGFGFYVNHFGTYDRIYGTLGAVIATLVWIWMSSMIFLVGAEINAIWRERWPAAEAATPAAEPEPAAATEHEPAADEPGGTDA